MGLFSSVGDLLTGDNSQSLGKSANQSILNVTTPGASSTFDEGSNRLTSTLDPQHKQFQDLLFNLGSGLLGQFQNQDFSQSAQHQYDLLSHLGRPQRDLQQQSLENRLFNQGLLGSTAGLNRMTALQDSFGQQDVQRQIAAQDFANQQRALMFQQGLMGLGGITTLDQVGSQPLSFANLGQMRAQMLTDQRNASNDIGAGLINSLIGSATKAASGGMGGGAGGMM